MDKILKGAKPADIPVEQATKFEFIINLEDSEADRTDDSAECAGESGSGHTVIADSSIRELEIRRMKVIFVFIFLLSAVFLPAASVAQQTGKIFHIGVLDNTTASGIAVRLQPFWQEVRNLGWIEGKNITIEYRSTERKPDRLHELAADLVRLKVDLILVTGTGATLAAKRATSTIPILMTSSSDPVGAGLVASLSRPGGNVTGVSSLVVELNTKRLEVLKDAVPKLARVGLPRPQLSDTSIAIGLQMKELRAASVALKLRLEEIETQLAPKSLMSFFQTAKQKQVNAIIVADPIYFAERKRIVDLAGKYRLPAIYPQKEYVDEGGLIYYGIDSTDLYRRAAVYVDKILKGAKPADLPVQQAAKFEFVINLKAAKQIGLTIPVRVLERANKVIK